MIDKRKNIINNITSKGVHIMSEIMNIFTKALTTNSNIPMGAVTRATGSNPFVQTSNNPFVTPKNSNPFANYGQNRPVAGGYFAGYYNNQPNIVGRRLFIEV